MPLPFLTRMHLTPKKYPSEQRDRATRMVLDRLKEYPSVWAAAQRLGPKLGVGPETLRKWVVQAQVDQGQRPGPSSQDLAEIKRLRDENCDLKESHAFPTATDWSGGKGFACGTNCGTDTLANDESPWIPRGFVSGRYWDRTSDLFRVRDKHRAQHSPVEHENSPSASPNVHPNPCPLS